MEFRASEQDVPLARLVVAGPEGEQLASFPLASTPVTIGRLPELNEIALQPDPELLVTRVAHCTLEREGRRWLVVDGGSVNGTYLRRKGELRRVTEPTPLSDGDVVCVLASATEAAERKYFELAFREPRDSQATRAVPLEDLGADACLTYDFGEARLLLVRGGERHEIQARAQAHRLVRYMAERNAAARSSVLCKHEELMQAVWGDEPMHTRMELAKLVWELRRKLEPFDAAHLLENERRLGYRLRTCDE